LPKQLQSAQIQGERLAEIVHSLIRSVHTFIDNARCWQSVLPNFGEIQKREEIPTAEKGKCQDGLPRELCLELSFKRWRKFASRIEWRPFWAWAKDRKGKKAWNVWETLKSSCDWWRVKGQSTQKFF
jgi:hypothetical protein